MPADWAEMSKNMRMIASLCIKSASRRVRRAGACQATVSIGPKIFQKNVFFPICAERGRREILPGIWRVTTDVRVSTLSEIRTRASLGWPRVSGQVPIRAASFFTVSAIANRRAFAGETFVDRQSKRNRGPHRAHRASDGH